MSRKKPDLLTQQARLRRKHREKGQVLAIFRKPMWESLTSVLPITAIVLLLCFTVTPVSNNAMMAFLVGSLLLIVGMGLFSLGSEMSMIPLGEAVGKEITRSKKVWVIVAISFLIGVIITVAEPDLQVLASQVPAIENNVIIWSVALGVGVFLEAEPKVGSWMDFITIIVVPFGAVLGAFSIYYVLGFDKIREEMELGRKKKLSPYFGPLAKYVYVPLAVIVFVLGILYGGIG